MSDEVTALWRARVKDAGVIGLLTGALRGIQLYLPAELRHKIDDVLEQAARSRETDDTTGVQERHAEQLGYCAVMHRERREDVEAKYGLRLTQDSGIVQQLATNGPDQSDTEGQPMYDGQTIRDRDIQCGE